MQSVYVEVIVQQCSLPCVAPKGQAVHTD